MSTDQVEKQHPTAIQNARRAYQNWRRRFVMAIFMDVHEENQLKRLFSNRQHRKATRPGAKHWINPSGFGGPTRAFVRGLRKEARRLA